MDSFPLAKWTVRPPTVTIAVMKATATPAARMKVQTPDRQIDKQETDLAGCLNTLPVPISRKDCPFPFKARFVFAYGVDNSDKPPRVANADCPL